MMPAAPHSAPSAWDGGTVGRHMPKTADAVSPTPTRSAPAIRQTRSPTVTTHQPYRGLPLSMFGVESELQSYAGAHAEPVVTVKAAYKTDTARLRPPAGQTPQMSQTASLALRAAQRSPITALDGEAAGGDPLTAHVTVGGFALPRAARVGTNKRIVSIDHMERCAGDGEAVPRCPIARRMAEAEEKHLNYTAVELPGAELNVGDTAELARRLQQRRRQMQYGKETVGYANYTRAVPNRWEREFRNPMHPMTPRPEYNCSKRTFDRYLNIWRRQLHLWDDYDAANVKPQYTRIGIPTLQQLGLEVSPSTPDGMQSGLISLTPIGSHNGGTACTPVTVRYGRRDASQPTAAFPRPNGPNGGNGGFPNGTATPVSMPHPMRPSSGCGGASWSTTNTPHTPFHGGGLSCHGSMHSNGSYPPLLSVLAQPMIYSPNWADSSRLSSPNPHSGKRSGVYYHTGGGNAGAGVGATSAAANNNNNNNNASSVGAANATSNPTMTGSGGVNNAPYWEANNGYYNNNNSGYGYQGYNSPYGGHRYTPHSTPNPHYPHYYPNGSMTGGGNNNGGGATTGAPMSVGQEQWGSPNRQFQ